MRALLVFAAFLATARCQCTGDENPVSFQETTLTKIKDCKALSLHSCQTYHEAFTQRCPCTCDQLKMKCKFETSCKTSTTTNDLNGQTGGGGGGGGGAQSDATTQAATTKKPGMGGGGGLDACFHGDTLVLTNQGRMSLAEMARRPQADVEVLSWNRVEQRAVFSPLRFWIHADPRQEADYVELVTETGRQLSITDNHVIYQSADCEMDGWKPVFAGKLVAGQCVFVNDGAKLEKLTSVTRSRKTGIYAPVTVEGSIIVNDIAASCFANNEDEGLQNFVYTYLLTAADWLKYVLPSEWMAQLFGIDVAGVHSSVPEFLLGFNYLQKSMLA